MTALRSSRTTLLTAVLVVTSIGCAHRGPDPFVYGPTSPKSERGAPPACFTGPVAPCLSEVLELSDLDRLSSRWDIAFQPDLSHRVCRSELDARSRVLDGARQLTEDESLKSSSRILLELISGCDSEEFCSWALSVAGDDAESSAVRGLFVEAVRRGCSNVVPMTELDRAAEKLGRTPSEEPPWVTSTQQQRCADFEHAAEPWANMETAFRAGCFDLGEWLDRHGSDREGTLDALERCVEKHEIRYREADCLREMAGLDRRRAVDWLRREERRGFGMSSTINRYARTLQRFPGEGRLETELSRLGLIPVAAKPKLVPGRHPVLSSEILESRARLHRFSPSCMPRYCEHAPTMYRLADLAGGRLDDVIIEERWPALEQVDLGSGPHKVATSVGGIPVTFHITESDDDAGTFDRSRYDQLRNAVEVARDEPHELRLYTDGKVYSLAVRRLGEFMNLEALVGGLNTILADRGSDWRLVTLAPHCIPCAQVAAGPRDGLVGATMQGLIEVVDPFHEQWTLPNFDPAQVEPSFPASETSRPDGSAQPVTR